MEKLLKSLFSSSSDKKKSSRFESMEEDFTPPLDDRRSMSISKSGRMKNNFKKRQSLNLDVFGETDIIAEKPRSVEYHVNPLNPVTSEKQNERRHSEDLKTTVLKPENQETKPENQETKPGNHRKGSVDIEDNRTPEEEIESAFEVIEKVL